MEAGQLPELLLEKRNLRCPRCKCKYPIERGIPNLVTDPKLRTKLEDIDYDTAHGIDEKRRINTFSDWQAVFDNQCVSTDRILEIGSGTGNLTWGLMHQSDFREVFATDISGKFLRGISDAFSAGAKNQTYYYICDANVLPFNKGTFDVVVGHSVLHHFLNYETTLESVFRILKPGGVAIFYEPIIQGKIFVAFILDLVSRIDRAQAMGVLDEKEHEKIRLIVGHITKEKRLGADKKKLAKMEDKYIFDLGSLSKLAHRIGYSEFGSMNYRELLPNYRAYVFHQWVMMGFDTIKLQKFEFIFDSFGETIGGLLAQTISTPMGFLIFRK